MTLQEVIEHVGYETRAYRGRGMSEECLAFSTSDSIGFLIGAFIQVPEAIMFDTDFEAMQSDSMGRGTVYYFPSVPFDGDER